MNKRLKTLPNFATEAEERAFWDSHDSSDYVDWSKAAKAVMPNLKTTTQTISLRLPLHLLETIKAGREIGRRNQTIHTCEKLTIASPARMALTYAQNA